MHETWFSVSLVVFMVLVSAQRLLETFSRRPKTEGDRFLRWSFPLMMLLHSLIFLGTVIEYFLVPRTINYCVSGIGAVLYLFSLVLRNVAIRALGRFFSLHIEIRDQHALIKEGVYGVVRHPIYVAVILELTSVPLVGNAYYTLLVTVFAYLPLLWLRLQREEEAMVAKFGDTYRVYQREVGALVPRWSAFRRR
jgi:isoprenylcysteine carboxyl methyltransferase (ICMT) family protein YpbQ